MKILRKFVFSLALASLAIPAISAQDLSKYRDFSLGTNLIEVSKQVDAKAADARVVAQHPALIQELSWWPVQSFESTAPVDPVQVVLFSFCNGELYRITATYDSTATRGLTDADMTKAISEKYGAATSPAAGTRPATTETYGSAGETIAYWQDSRYSVTLSRSPLSDAFQLVMFSKQLNGQAEAAIAAASKEQRDDAPQREIARVKKEADDLEAARQANLKAFQP
jgi:hypothetical protein